MSVDNCRGFSDEEITEALKYGATKLGLQNGFHSQQASALRSFIRGHDLFVSLPTGYGKSVIFQAAPICMDFLRRNASSSGLGIPDPLKSVALVVMPLKSLISDQIHKLDAHGLIGVDISGGMTDTIREGISCGKYSHIFAGPEILLEEDGREMFTLLKDRLWICGFFIDESHCVSKWGSSSGNTKAFRSAYSKLGEIRSKLRSNVPAVALTATATKEVRQAVIDSLGLKNYVLLNKSPDKKNIKHVVMRSPSKDFDKIFQTVIEEVKAKGASCERTIIYCQSRATCSDVYTRFRVGLPKYQRKFVNMFHTNTDDDIQEQIINSMATPDGDVRVLVATIAYGMGVDASKVHRTILCGRSGSLDDYIQMSGRVGRDGEQSVAITVCYPGDTAGRATSSSMKDFIGGTRCRRSVIQEVFGPSSENSIIQHNCCDICSQSCDCGCQGKEIGPFERSVKRSLEAREVEEFPLNIPTPKQVDKLERELEDYRSSLLSSEPDFIYCGADISCGLPSATINRIVKECNVEMNFAAFSRRYSLPRRKINSDVWTIVCDALGRSGSHNGSEQGCTNTVFMPETDDSMMYETDEDECESSDDEYQRPVIVSDSD